MAKNTSKIIPWPLKSPGETAPAGARTLKQPRLLQRVREAIRVRHFSQATERSYVR